MCDKKPRPHADLIKAWADGARIQVFMRDTWCDTDPPAFQVGGTYRIKPEPSDLEKYGVEKGDVWITDEASTFFNLLVLRHHEGKTTCLNTVTGLVGVVCMAEIDADLVFRRGVVDKL